MIGALLSRQFRRAWPLLGLTVLLVLLSLGVGVGFGLRTAVIVALINTILVVGLYVFVGNSGILSFGHVAFMAVGAYGSALLTIPEGTKRVLLPNLPGLLTRVELPVVLAVTIVAVCTGVAAYLVAIPLMRLSGLAAALATLALLEIVRVFLVEWRGAGRGTLTLTGVPIETTLGGATVWLVLVLVITYVFQRSRFGLRLRASREDEVAARGSGIAVQPERRLAFALSAVITAIGGALYAHFIGVLSPAAFSLLLTFQIIAMLVIGGLFSLAGAVVGAVVISALYEVFSRLEAGQAVGPLSVRLPAGLREILVAALVLVILARRPEGLMAGHELRWPFGRADGPIRSGPESEPRMTRPRLRTDERANAARSGVREPHSVDQPGNGGS